MRIADAWGSAHVELQPVAYEFPAHAPSSGQEFDWDANWLQIRGDVRTAELSWSFTDPCLTTTEARELHRWLVDVARENVLPRSEVFGRGSSFFTEPTLSIRSAAREADRCTLVWHFSQESSPPGSSEEVRYGEGYAVETTVTAHDLLLAADEWAAELVRFPVRDTV